MDDWLTRVLLVLLFLFFAWYFIGKRMNKQRAFHFMAALRSIFSEELGGKAAFKSQEYLVVVDPVAPYASVDLRLMLEARDIIVLWLFDHFARGKRDQFVLRARFQAEPKHDLLVADPTSSFGQISLNHARQKGLYIENTQGADGRVLAFAASSGAHKKMAGHLARAVLQQRWPVAVISFDKDRPHHLVAVCAMSPESFVPDFFRRVRRLAVEVSK